MIKNVIGFSIILLLNGCSISIGGGSSSNSNDIVYDCSTISDVAQEELTKRRKVCGTGTTMFEDDCRKEAVSSVCKPMLNNVK